MIRVDDGGTQIMDMGLQQSHEEMICYWLLKEIQDYDGAVGAWTLKELLDNKGKHFSSATIGRYLKMMDGNAFTVRESNKGRAAGGFRTTCPRRNAQQSVKSNTH